MTDQHHVIVAVVSYDSDGQEIDYDVADGSVACVKSKLLATEIAAAIHAIGRKQAKKLGRFNVEPWKADPEEMFAGGTETSVKPR